MTGLAVADATRMTSESTVIDVRSVSRLFAGRSGVVEALQDVVLSITANEFVSFVGPSGCGKSTLLSIVAGLLPPSSGTVLLDGAKVTGPSRDVGVMFQAPVLLPWRTVEKNVLLPAEVFKADMDAARTRAREVIELVRLEEFVRSYPRELSGGMQQRVALARVLATEPKVVLMDEPFGALDEFTREAMNLELLRITDAAEMTVLFVTHNITEAVFLSDRVVVMTPRPGRIAGIVDVGFERPRRISMMHDPTFADLVFDVRRMLGGRE
jgi:NitT/TauT family transport system ATP-binding protein